MLTVNASKGVDVARYHFELPRGDSDKDALLVSDAALVASYIAECITNGQANGKRSPGDFLVLTRNKGPVAYYARALARQNIPATTTGSGLSQEHELRELLVVLRALADPDNGLCVAAALEGLFFGLSPADLWAGKQEGLRFSITHRPSGIESRTGKALLCLYEWWTVSQREPVDVLIERIFDETGLLFHATSQELGDARAGALLHIVESMRAASTAGAGSVMAAIERIDALLGESLDDISLRPGRTDAVRVMNVHQAKGLEAPVVILAAPVDRKLFPPLVHIRRTAEGAALGGMCVGFKQGQRYVTLAQCAGWEAMQEAEAQYEAAEEARLLYVATTRAREQLVVGQFTQIPAAMTKSADAKVTPDRSVWRPLAPMLEQHATLLEIMPRALAERRLVTQEAADIQQAALAAKRTVEAARKASITVQTVTQSAKDSDDVRPFVLRTPSGSKGKAWGRAVHRVIEAYLRGRRDAQLTAFARAVAKDERLDAALTAELATFAASAATATWSAAIAAGAQVATELTVMHHVMHEDTAVVTEGVIDAAVLHDGGWHVVDWKTDSVDATEWSQRLVAYRRQVETYGDLLTAMTGLPAEVRVERVLT
jgi:ATP-dependent helicase/nuclease subunit A